MIEYKHNHLLFLSNPLVDPDNNLCERKARILKGKINQAISLRSFEHLTYFCECLGVLDHFATDNRDNLYQSVKEVFKRKSPDKPKSKKQNLLMKNEGLIRVPDHHALFPHPVKSNFYLYVKKYFPKFLLDKTVRIPYSMQYKEKAVTKRSTHYPLKEKVAVPKKDAERLPEGRSAEGSFQAGSLKEAVDGRKVFNRIQ